MTDKFLEGVRLTNEILNTNLKEDFNGCIKAGRTITAEEMYLILKTVETLLIPKSATPEGTLRMVSFNEDRKRRN